ncbi:PAAR-like protein, partial [Flavobacterium araucananum]
GNCKKSPNSASPCASVMKLADWKDVGTVYFQDKFPLLLKSTIKCEYGGVDVTITDSAQRNVIEKIDTTGAPVPSVVKTEPYKCTHCEEEITSEFLRKTIGAKKLSSKQAEIIDLFLPYLNKYRKNFGLDTCLRKAHFLSQIGVESANFTTFSEYENYSNPPGIFSSSLIQINSTIVSSLKDNLTSIFKIIDAKGEVIIKTNDELKTLLLKDKPSIVDKELYAAYKGEKDSKDKKKYNDKLIKEILKTDKTVDYKIYLKSHSHFGIPLMSRAYAPYVGDKRGLGNGDELTRDGWKFKGRGLKQLTGRGNYLNFTNYRNKNTFTDDTSGQIDFTAEKDGSQLKGNYLKISDDAMYATQSALYFWNDGTKKNKKFAKEHADNDDIELVIKCVNEYDGKDGKNNRRANFKRARKEGVFDINRHYKLMLENGDDKQKEEAKNYLEKQKNNGDEEATKILEEEEKKNPTKKEEVKSKKK